MVDLPIFDSQGRAHYPTRITPQQLEQEARARAERQQAAITARQQREADHQAAREKAERDQGAAELEAYREQALNAYLASGGTSADWLKNWDVLKGDYLRDRAKERMGARERKVAEMVQKMKASRRYPI
jgi:hypothetical protein